MAKLKVGDKVRVKQPTEAYYSKYAGNPQVIITPELVGTVKATDVPYVRRIEGFFVCVDYEIPGVFQGNPIYQNCTWRIGTPEKNLIRTE